ncbi:alpha/beta hydrolase [Legionella israelensis]|uniref:Alpha/beta hydrolase n=1 Tax=Legionella israelensis TaxID=454 RepID=A0AAX1EDX6_9GAMM|nr:alpha/beta hydrolase [Legionella israelensis]QBR83264.1 alpha/beta hydrolase [Legionella israelensis]
MKEFNLTIPGLTIACKSWGSPESPPVLALHGWLDNANTFDKLAPFLEKNFYLIAVDLPGHGMSSHLAEGCHYHFIDGIFAVVNIINALGFEKIHLLGHSMGACLASLAGGVAADKILSLSLIEGLGPFTSSPDTANIQLSDYIKHQILTDKKPVRGYKSVEKAAEARAKRGHVSIEAARILCKRGIKKENHLYYWQHDRRLLIPSPLRMTEEQVLSCLKAIIVKTCLIWASEGYSFNLETMETRMKVVKQLQTHQLKGGHHIHMEKPQEVAKRLLSFYQNL